METRALMGRPFLRCAEMTVGAYASGVADLTLTLPDWATDGAVALSVYPRAALLDHQVLSILHNEQEHVTKDTVSSVDYGAPLGHVASFIGRDNVTASQPMAPGKALKLWPGFDRNEGMPCERQVGMIPVKGTREFKITVKRILGATAITKAYLWLAPIADKLVHARMCDGRKEMVGRPHWLVKKLELAAGAGLNNTEAERRWNAYDDKSLRILQVMSAAYSNNGGVVAYDPTYADAAALRIRGWAGEKLFPDYAEDPRLISELGPLQLQDWDCLRDPQIAIAAKSGLRILDERAETTFQKDIYMSFYGVLAD